MALKLIDIAGRGGDAVQRAYVETFASATPLMGAIPVEDASSGVYEVVREASLGSASFRRINEGYTASEGREEIQRYYARPAGGDADVDRAITRRRPNARASTEAMK